MVHARQSRICLTALKCDLDPLLEFADSWRKKAFLDSSSTSAGLHEILAHLAPDSGGRRFKNLRGVESLTVSSTMLRFPCLRLGHS